jgi:hypothetical protein
LRNTSAAQDLSQKLPGKREFTLGNFNVNSGNMLRAGTAFLGTPMSSTDN